MSPFTEVFILFFLLIKFVFAFFTPPFLSLSHFSDRDSLVDIEVMGGFELVKLHSKACDSDAAVLTHGCGGRGGRGRRGRRGEE